MKCKVHLHSCFNQAKPCKSLVGCLWYLPCGSPPFSVWLPVADCGGSVLLKLPFILHWINLLWHLPVFPLLHPCPPQTQSLSFSWKLCQSFICLWLECSSSFSNYEYMKEKYFLSIIINHSLLSGELDRVFLKYLWYSACLLCWFCISEWVHFE